MLAYECRKVNATKLIQQNKFNRVSNTERIQLSKCKLSGRGSNNLTAFRLELQSLKGLIQNYTPLLKNIEMVAKEI